MRKLWISLARYSERRFDLTLRQSEEKLKRQAGRLEGLLAFLEEVFTLKVYLYLQVGLNHGKH